MGPPPWLAVNRRASVAAAFVLLCAIWGSTWLAIKFGVEAVPTFLSDALRFSIAASVLLAAAAVLRRGLPRSRSEWAATAFVGLVLFVGDYGLIYWGEANGAPSGLAAVLFAVMPLLTALAAQGIGRTERLTAQKVLGIAVGFGGLALIFRSQLAVAGVGQLLPLLAIILGASCAAVATVVMKRWARDIDGFTFNGIAMAIGAAGLASISLLAGEPWAVPPWPGGLVPILYLSLAGSVVAFLTYKWLLLHVEATTAAYNTMVTPIVALALGALVASETFEPLDLAGAAVTLLGIYLSLARRLGAWGRARAEDAVPPPADAK